jgi:hypothetical protein
MQQYIPSFGMLPSMVLLMHVFHSTTTFAISSYNVGGDSFPTHSHHAQWLATTANKTLLTLH